MVKQNEYLLQLLDEIERLRKNSINNVKKTDLYTREDICKIIDWYDQLIHICSIKFPTAWVNALVITEDRYGNIRSVEYAYSKNKSLIEVILD